MQCDWSWFSAVGEAATRKSGSCGFRLWCWEIVDQWSPRSEREQDMSASHRHNEPAAELLAALRFAPPCPLPF